MTSSSQQITPKTNMNFRERVPTVRTGMEKKIENSICFDSKIEQNSSKSSADSKGSHNNTTKPSVGINSTRNTGPGDNKPTYYWNKFFKKIAETSVKECKNTATDLPLIHRKLQKFATGSSYVGEWSILGMSGHGVYTFPNGVRYEGEFNAGEFHGEGKLIYPNGCELLGKFEYGEIKDRKLIFANELQYEEEDWAYCKMPDRRYAVEFNDGVKPAGESYITADASTPEIPLGMYDTGDGFLDSKTLMIHDRDNYNKVLRGPAEPERKWIMNTNRRNPMRALGPRRDLYEEWQQPFLELPETCQSRIYEQAMAARMSSESRHPTFDDRPSVSKIFRETSVSTVKSYRMSARSKKKNGAYTRPSISFT